ncbi:MAG: ferritin-like domain-containing protein [Deltaproteobacteria bacterium]|nr:ferritin-like domain-containing protein [Deltaproteobacteria bacterium]
MIALDLRDAARAHRPALEADPRARASAIATWRGRMINEWSSSRVFGALAAQMERAGAFAARVSEIEAFAEEERTHGVLCGAVVEALGGEARADLPDCPPIPEHTGVDPEVAVLRNVLSICCLSETVAVALIAAERLEMPEGALRDLLTRIWSDEIGHARFGWTLLGEVVPALSPERRAGLAAYVPTALAHLVEHELAHLPATRGTPPGGEALGLCAGEDARALFFDTVEQVIHPRLSELGLVEDTSDGRRVLSDTTGR